MTLITETTEKGRVRIVITAADGDSVTVTRTHPSGKVVTVRGMDHAPLSGGAFLGWDYEAPISVPVAYTVTAWVDPDTILATSPPTTVTYTSQWEWLKDPLEPIRNLPVTIRDMSQYTYDSRTGIHVVLGRPAPITVGEVRSAAAGTLTLITYNKDERDRLHYLTASGHALLLQSTQESGIGNMYIALTGVAETRLVATRNRAERVWELAYVEVDSPVGDAGVFVTWNDLVNAPGILTWADVIATWDTWLELNEELGSTTKPPILTWRGN